LHKTQQQQPRAESASNAAPAHPNDVEDTPQRKRQRTDLEGTQNTVLSNAERQHPPHPPRPESESTPGRNLNTQADIDDDKDTHYVLTTHKHSGFEEDFVLGEVVDCRTGFKVQLDQIHCCGSNGSILRGLALHRDTPGIFREVKKFLNYRARLENGIEQPRGKWKTIKPACDTGYQTSVGSLGQNKNHATNKQICSMPHHACCLYSFPVGFVCVSHSFSSCVVLVL